VLSEASTRVYEHRLPSSHSHVWLPCVHSMAGYPAARGVRCLDARVHHELLRQPLNCHLRGCAQCQPLGSLCSLRPAHACTSTGCPAAIATSPPGAHNVAGCPAAHGVRCLDVHVHHELLRQPLSHSPARERLKLGCQAARALRCLNVRVSAQAARQPLEFHRECA
jgi:hypothetical protein